MIERSPVFDTVCQVVLFLGLLIAVTPFVVVLIAATHDIRAVNQVPMPIVPGMHFLDNVAVAWERADLGRKLFNSFVFACTVAFGKVALSMLAAFAIVYFRFPGRMAIFWAVFITLMLPLEVRIVPTYAVAANALQPFQVILDLTGISWLVQTLSGIRVDLHWGLLNSYTGLALPLVATATGTFLFRQFFLTLPDELAEAAKMDGAGPVRFFFQILLPLSKPNMAALATIMFVWAWNQYLWPLLVTTDPRFGTAATELKELIPAKEGVPEWHVAMAGTLLVMLPPLLVMIAMQRFFVRGLVATDK